MIILMFMIIVKKLIIYKMLYTCNIPDKLKNKLQNTTELNDNANKTLQIKQHLLERIKHKAQVALLQMLARWVPHFVPFLSVSQQPPFPQANTNI